MVSENQDPIADTVVDLLNRDKYHLRCAKSFALPLTIRCKMEEDIQALEDVERAELDSALGDDE